MRTQTTLAAVAALLALAGCATQPPEPSVSVEHQHQPRAPVSLSDVVIPESTTQSAPVPMMSDERPTEKESMNAVASSRTAGIVLPTLSCFSGGTCRYWYQPDKPYRVNVAIGDTTLVCLKPGEVHVETIVAGKQEWVGNDTHWYEDEEGKRVCVSLFPKGIPQDKGYDGWIMTVGDENGPGRKYALDIRVYGSKQRKYKHREVMWRYPEDEVNRINGIVPEVRKRDNRDRTTGMHPRERNCAYDMTGSTAAWRPVPTHDQQPPVCDDGQMTVINFKPGILGPYQSPSLQRVVDGVRHPIDYRRYNSTYIATGLHDELLLSIGAEEVSIKRKHQAGGKQQ
jgi:type IV secretion system protein VirB9